MQKHDSLRFSLEIHLEKSDILYDLSTSFQIEVTQKAIKLFFEDRSVLID